MTAFRTSRQLPAKPNVVFAAFSDPSRLAKWWGPIGFSNIFQLFDFKQGGNWNFTMIAPDGKKYPNESVFTQIIKNKQIVIKHLSQPLFELSITLHENDVGTLVDWEQVFADASVAGAIRHIVEPANEQNLDRLANAIQTGS